MSIEKKSGYYDSIFESDSSFNVHYKDSPYWVHWTQVIKYIKSKKESMILEIGCGTGQFAEYIRDEGFINYLGFDFSPLAIEKAKVRLPGVNFFCGNALDTNIYPDKYDVVICLEVLEHVKNDLEVLKNIRIGKEVIFSVPNFWAESHVRWFISERQIKKRYYKLLKIEAITKVGSIYICKCVREDFKPNMFQRVVKSNERLTLSSIKNRYLHLLNKLKTFFPS